MNKEHIISEFRLKPFGSKGFFKGSLACPICGRSDKFGIIFSNQGSGVTHCFYCSTSVPLFRILKALGRTDLLDYNYEYKGKKELASLQKEIIQENKEVTLPIGFRSILYDEYLHNRGFTKEQYQQFKVGVAELDPRTENKIIFQIYQNQKFAGWIARSRESKEWHHENLRKYKELGEPLVLRYRNSENDFSKILGGLDEITPNTHTLILVEGLMDKANIDRLMFLNDQEEVKCCFTFGSDLSVDQIDLIPSTVENVILMYDEGTLNNIREAGSRLISLFTVKVALIKEKNIDPGNIDADRLSKLFLNMIDFLYFYRHILTPKHKII